MVCSSSIFCLQQDYTEALPPVRSGSLLLCTHSAWLYIFQENCRGFASFASWTVMVSNSDPLPQFQPDTMETSLMRPPENVRHPSLAEWGSKAIRQCDAKTLSARRKRLEIRRLKLVVAAQEELDAEPLPKRAKVVAKTVSGSLRGCELDDLTDAHKSNMGAETMNVVATVSAPQEQDSNKDEEGGAGLRSRLAVSGNDVACPSHCIVSICGRSRVMEDAAIAVPSFLSMPSQTADHAGGSAHTGTFHFFGVYDGHGGPQAAEFCKEKMHGVLAEEMSAAANGSPSHLEVCMQSCFKRLDDELCGACPHGSECPRKADSCKTGSSSSCREPLVPGSVGTTAVVAVVGDHHIVVGNCGDSRAVLSRGGKAVPLSVDHKANRPDEVARIEAAGGQVFPWGGSRVCGVLAMSRSLGDGYLKPFVSGQPEVTITERTDDDECLILASDGLWDVLSSKYVCNVARMAMRNWRRQHKNFQHRYPLYVDHSEKQELGSEVDTQDSPAQVVAAMLVKLALARNSKDNISVVVVDLKRL